MDLAPGTAVSLLASIEKVQMCAVTPTAKTTPAGLKKNIIKFNAGMNYFFNPISLKRSLRYSPAVASS